MENFSLAVWQLSQFIRIPGALPETAQVGAPLKVKKRKRVKLGDRFSPNWKHQKLNFQKTMNFRNRPLRGSVLLLL